MRMEKTGLRMAWQLESVGLGDRLCLGVREGGTSITPKLLALEHKDLLLKSFSKPLYVIHHAIKDVPVL